MKNIFLFITCILFINKGFGQQAPETTDYTHKISDDVSEKFHVLKDNKGIKEGLYQAYYNKKTAIASGMYNNDKKVGVWHFFDSKGNLLQNFDYTSKKLLYEAPELKTNSKLGYFVDKELTDTDRTTKPVKAGGRYYGYLPYALLFKLPGNLMDINRAASYAVIELLVSPGGRLADYKVHLVSGNFQKTFKMNINALSDEDKEFIPATVNGEPIGCRISITCSIDFHGRLNCIE